MKKQKKKFGEIFHDLGCIMFIIVGVLGLIRLTSYLLYNTHPEMNLVLYLIFLVFEILLGIFGAIELKKRYLIKK